MQNRFKYLSPHKVNLYAGFNQESEDDAMNGYKKIGSTNNRHNCN